MIPAIFTVSAIVLITGLCVGLITYLGGSDTSVKQEEDDDYLPPDADQCIRVLQVIRIAHGSTHFERECIDYAIESIEIRARLEKYLNERGV